MKQDLRILSLNVWGLPWPLSRARRQRFARLRRQLGHWDLLGLQEVWRPWSLDLPVPGLRHPESSGDAGLAIAGSLADSAEDVRLTHFSRARGTDRLASKGVLLSELHLQAGAVRIGVTHLNASRSGATVRRHQVDELLDAVGEGPAVLMGDFNFYAGHDEGSEQALHDAGFVDAGGAEAVPTYLPRNPFVLHREAQRFDRVYVRSGEAVEVEARGLRVLPRLWSDHQPVAVDLRVAAR
jgi:endonuclease/exonuclease/phosphatase family metal-dependent hydrolase